MSADAADGGTSTSTSGTLMGDASDKCGSVLVCHSGIGGVVDGTLVEGNGVRLSVGG